MFPATASILVLMVGLAAVPSPIKKPVIAIALIGDAQAPVASLDPILAEAFGSEIVEAPHVALPHSAWNSERGQYLSTRLLDVLAAAKKPEWERLLGIAEVDLYVPDLNFVFGEADPRRGVGVFSMTRLRAGADEALLRRRAATEAVHELGHTYGLSHCSKPACVMWFSNTLAESDRKGTRFCADHARELAERKERGTRSE